MKDYISIRAVMAYLGRFKPVVYTMIFTYTIANLAIAIVPWLVGRLTNSMEQQNDMIVWWTVALVASSAVHSVFWHGSEVIWLRKLLATSHRFDDVVFAAIIKHNYGYFVDRFTGKISSYATGLGRDFRELLDNTFNQYLNIPIILPVLAATMFTVNLITGIVFIVVIVLLFVCGKQLAIKSAQAERREADESSTVDGQVVDAIANFVSVKAFGSERREAARLFELRRALIKAGEYSFFRSILFWATMSTIVRMFAFSALLVLNVYLYTQGQLSLAQITTFLAAVLVFTNTIWEVIWSFSQLNIMLARMEEAYRYLFGDRNIFTGQDAHHVQATAGFTSSLQLQRMSFAYPDQPDTQVLHDITMHIARGDKIGIVGPSGGGKSTLIKLLLGYYPMDQDTLLVDGRPTDNRSLTNITAYVPQDTSIFHRSIRDNIAYARPDASNDEIVAAAKHAQAHDFIMALDKGYDTLVGERGVKLSGGQRQRIAIARAILKDAPLLLLDEATSALDSESEQLIQRALRDLLKGRTALVIAHRLSTIQHMDRIIVIDNGRIVEQGDHVSLLAAKGAYAKLWNHQTDGFIHDK